MDTTDRDVIATLQMMDELHDLGLSIQREKFRLENPGASPKQIEARLRAWVGHGGFEEPDPPFRIAPPRKLHKAFSGGA